VQHHYEGHWKGCALKIETILGPEIGPKKVEIITTGTLTVISKLLKRLSRIAEK
jgi:hypothetical protein